VRFEEATRAARPAYCHLESGAVLRYEPVDGRITVLSYPATPSKWREAKEFLGLVPKGGWQHLPGCRCGLCPTEAARCVGGQP
jgi:hypothetical protein